MSIRYDIELKQSTTFNLPIKVETSPDEPVDFTGFSARSQVREKYDSAVIIDFKDDFSTPYWIIWDDKPNGKLRLHITSANTANLVPITARYDLLATSNTVIKILEGQFRVLDTITEL